MTAAQQSATDAEKRVQMRVAELKSKATALRRSELDSDREQSMKDMYEDMIDKLSQLHTGSRHSQRNSLMNKRRMLEEQVLSLTTKTNQIRAEVDRLTAELDATGYQGLLHETRRSAIDTMKVRHTEMKNELVRIRLATVSLRTRARSSQ
ncbi:hypothetical protein KIN20_017710 [Parelaphostrongylus tenuis]|nr:hypothetical protein KIN20_017710 [Parelaphostrongylus tenuis]